jgi:hypothetical protein
MADQKPLTKEEVEAIVRQFSSEISNSLRNIENKLPKKKESELGPVQEPPKKDPIDTVSNKVDDVKKEIGKVENSSNAIKSKLGNITVNLDDIGKDVKQIDSEISDIKAISQESSGLVSSLKTSFDGYVNKMTGGNSGIESLRKNISGQISNNKEIHDKRFEKIDSTLETIGGSISGLKTSIVAELGKTQFADLNKNIKLHIGELKHLLETIKTSTTEKDEEGETVTVTYINKRFEHFNKTLTDQVKSIKDNLTSISTNTSKHFENIHKHLKSEITNVDVNSDTRTDMVKGAITEHLENLLSIIDTNKATASKGQGDFNSKIFSALVDTKYAVLNKLDEITKRIITADQKSDELELKREKAEEKKQKRDEFFQKLQDKKKKKNDVTKEFLEGLFEKFGVRKKKKLNVKKEKPNWMKWLAKAGLLIALGAYIIKNWETIWESFKKIWDDYLWPGIVKIWNMIDWKAIGTGALGLFEWFGTKIIDLGIYIKDWFMGNLPGQKKAGYQIIWDGVTDAFTMLWNDPKKLAAIVLGGAAILSMTSILGGGLLSIFSRGLIGRSLMKLPFKVLFGGLKVVGRIGGFIVGGVTRLVTSGVGRLLSGAGKMVTNFISNASKSVTNLLKNNKLPTPPKPPKPTSKPWYKRAASWVGDKAKKAGKLVVKGAKAVGKGVVKGASKLNPMNALRSFVKSKGGKLFASLLKKVPGLSALITPIIAGFQVKSILNDPGLKPKEKQKRTGQIIAGAIGGSLGALLGGVGIQALNILPGLGLLLTPLGAAAGGYLGDILGEQLSKIGGMDEKIGKLVGDYIPGVDYNKTEKQRKDMIDKNESKRPSSIFDPIPSEVAKNKQQQDLKILPITKLVDENVMSKGKQEGKTMSAIISDQIEITDPQKDKARFEELSKRHTKYSMEEEMNTGYRSSGIKVDDDGKKKTSEYIRQNAAETKAMNRTNNKGKEESKGEDTLDDVNEKLIDLQQMVQAVGTVSGEGAKMTMKAINNVGQSMAGIINTRTEELAGSSFDPRGEV